MDDEWRWPRSLLFAAAVCGFNLLLSAAASFGPQIELAFPGIKSSIGSRFVLVMLAGLMPAMACLVLYPDTRESLKRWKAPLAVYPAAIGFGLFVPFMSYFGSHSASFPWDYASRSTLIRVFFLNIFLMPLWEDHLARMLPGKAENIHI
jgi:hypothetical protein